MSVALNMANIKPSPLWTDSADAVCKSLMSDEWDLNFMPSIRASGAEISDFHTEK